MLKRATAKLSNAADRVKSQLEVTKPATKDYRGFDTSITHSFLDKRHRQTDACSLACCGMLQSDRDRYLLTGIRPPSWIRRFFVHFMTPLMLFLVACWGATHISNAYLNQLLSTMLVVFLILLMVMQLCCKARWKKVLVRKEVLWRKYQFNSPDSSMPSPDQEDDDYEHAKLYLQGQSYWDLQCAHAVIGCYRNDYDAADQEEPKDICAWLFRLYTKSCFGCCGFQLQVCGVCALAQEARELELMVPSDRRRRMDYVTMENSLDYYAEVLQALQQSTTHYAWWSWNLLSQLSKQLLQLWVIAVVSLVVLAIALRFSLAHVLIFIGTFAHAWLVLYLVHGVWHSRTVSFDLVIKAFTCGFFLVVILAVSWEVACGLVFKLFIDILMALSGISMAVDEDGYDMTTFGGFGVAAATRKEYLEAYGQNHPFVYALLLVIHAFILAAFLEELAKYMGFNMILDHPDFWTRSELESAVSVAVNNAAHSANDQIDEDNSIQASVPSIEEVTSDQKATDYDVKMKLMELPFAMQEKTMEQKGAAITICMVAIALGFACCENLAYVFVYNENSLSVGK